MSLFSGFFGSGNIVKMLFPAFAKVMKEHGSTVHLYPKMDHEGVEIVLSKNKDVDRLTNEIIDDDDSYIMGKKNGKVFCRKAYRKKPEEGEYSEMKFYFKKDDLSPSLSYLFMEKGVRFFVPSEKVEDDDITRMIKSVDIEINEDE